MRGKYVWSHRLNIQVNTRKRKTCIFICLFWVCFFFLEYLPFPITNTWYTIRWDSDSKYNRNLDLTTGLIVLLFMCSCLLVRVSLYVCLCVYVFNCLDLLGKCSWNFNYSELEGQGQSKGRQIQKHLENMNTQRENKDPWPWKPIRFWGSYACTKNELWSWIMTDNQ